MIFKKNDTFTVNGQTVTILDELGDGGQGEVYLVDYRGEKLAFKLYKYQVSEDFIYNLRTNCEKGAPSRNFLWPKEIVQFEDGDVGYMMDVRPKNYHSFVSYLTGNTKFKSTHELLRWCIELVKSFKELHERGFSYQDLNDGSFFLDPDDGSILICDNDNVTADKRNLGVLGKMRYMAPEIVRGDKDRLTGERQLPDIHSDRFSLAVILFLALCLGNPFEGECLKKYDIIDEKSDMEMFGTKPVYIYSQIDTSNRPIRGFHTAVLKRYPLLPSYIKEAFHRTFTDGLKDRENSRTTEIEWLKLLSKYRDELISCPSCGRQYIYGFSEKYHNDKCPYCANPTKRFTMIQIGRQRIALEPGKKIYETSIDKFSPEYNKPVAEVIRNKNNPNLFGIRLNLNESVEIKDKNGTVKQIDAKGVIPIVNELKIRFGENKIAQITTITNE